MSKQTAPVPLRYRGVWQRSLLETAEASDTTTTVFWLQTSRWHADLRIPAQRPDFSAVQGLYQCSLAQLQWLTQQQGFAGITQVATAAGDEVCSWHRELDFQQPSAMPDAGIMRFETNKLVETGVHAPYLEDWHRLAGSDEGFAVLRKRATTTPQLLLVAGRYVMQVRCRNARWPRYASWPVDAQSLQALLDFEISFGERSEKGWRITHSSLPWMESRDVALQMSQPDANYVTLEAADEKADWDVLEWTAPSP